ncbi:hypothetical protein M758_8G059700 [Ceratodon purpureus]|uniref:Uncharacterized protein n=1 Tax=Ceratodon purpureus TaxID=3225 RepID=A0A8T0GZ61_CERPU|nr:hypothetical protein KC19_8G063100 [Ceratodon purpureus]KAG0607849.1 hypothetical protein M758_8G059700 [Ceratodon purpureus]
MTNLKTSLGVTTDARVMPGFKFWSLLLVLRTQFQSEETARHEKNEQKSFNPDECTSIATRIAQPNHLRPRPAGCNTNVGNPNIVSISKEHLLDCADNNIWR